MQTTEPRRYSLMPPAPSLTHQAAGREEKVEAQREGASTSPPREPYSRQCLASTARRALERREIPSPLARTAEPYYVLFSLVAAFSGLVSGVGVLSLRPRYKRSLIIIRKLENGWAVKNLCWNLHE